MPSSRDSATGQLVHAWLSGVEYSENADFDIEKDHVRYSVDERHDIEIYGEHQDAADLKLHLSINWRNVEDDEEHKGPFSIRVEVIGHFHCETESDEEAFRSWLDFNGPYLLRPYARTYIANITAQSRWPSLTIFTLELPQPLLDEEASDLEPANDRTEGPSAG